MKTLTGIDLFVQALLIFGLLGTGAASVLEQNYIFYFLLLLFATGVWQLGSALVGSFYHWDEYKCVFLAASTMYCSFLAFLSGSNRLSLSDQFAKVTLVTFLGIIPVFAAMIYFYLSVDAFNRRMQAKKEAEFV